MCSMAAFKGHCAFNFWDAKGVLGNDAEAGAMGQFGRITSLKDLPSKKVLTGYVKKAMALKDAGTLPEWVAQRRVRREIAVPEDLAVALNKNKKAAAAFENFSPSHRREYVEWITEAKRDATRAKRVAEAVAWLAEGKARNWKYM